MMEDISEENLDDIHGIDIFHLNVVTGFMTISAGVENSDESNKNTSVVEKDAPCANTKVMLCCMIM